MMNWLADLKYAARGLARAPLFTVGVVLTLALGIGVNALMFGAVRTLYFRAPGGIERSEDVSRVLITRGTPEDNWTQASTNYPTYLDLRSQSSGLSAVAGVARRRLSLGKGAEAVQAQVLVATPEFFPLTGVKPALGRFYQAADDAPGQPPVAVITYALWLTRFGGDSAVIGKTLAFPNATYTIIGVTQEGFDGIDLQPVDLFLPMETAARNGDNASEDALKNRNNFWLHILARVKPGAGNDGEAPLATQALRRGALADKSDDSTATVVLASLLQARGPNASQEAKVSVWIAGVALIVLLIACANVANLLMVRGFSRQRELAVRASLGAGRAGLARLLLSESLILAVAGGAIAILAASWGDALVRSLLLPDLPATTSLTDPTVIMVAAVVSILCALVNGLIPAWQSGRIVSGLSSAGGSRGAVQGLGRARPILLGIQVALTLVLLVGAGLFARSLQNVRGIDIGLDADHVLAVQLDLPGMSGDTGRLRKLELLQRIRHTPGVTSAAATMGSPFGNSYAIQMRVGGKDSLPRFAGGGPYVQAVSPEYLATLGAQVSVGRDFTASDAAGAELVAIVNQTFASKVWGTASPIGECLYLKDEKCRRIVGVTASIKRNAILEPGSVSYYLPMDQFDQPSLSAIMVRTAGDPHSAVSAIRRHVQELNLPYVAIDPLNDLIAPQLSSWRLGAVAFTVFSLLALLIATVGVFAVLSYGVSQRTREIGVRMALGARRAQVIQLIVTQGLKATAFGAMAGLVGAWLLARAMRTLLYGVEPGDPRVFLVSITVLLVTAGIAALLPARRASRIDPMTALRAE